MSLWRRALTVIAAATLLAALTPGAAVASSHPDAFIALRTRQAHQARPVRSSNIFSHGGAVQVTTTVYISYWGPEWASGFATGGYTSGQAQTYVNDFFTNVGGTSWINTDTQYCQNVPNGTYFCSQAASPVYIKNLTGQFVAANAWNDTTPVPSSPTQSDIAAAATRLMQHYGYSNQASYMVFTPSGKSMTGFAVQWCAWHSSTSTSSGTIAYGYVPYQPDAGTSCGMNFVNKSDDAYGHGYFDGFSIVAGHEYEEAQTDPFPNTGWQDRNGNEDADKCAWNSASTNLAVGTNFWAVQPLWSNAANANAGGCVTSY